MIKSFWLVIFIVVLLALGIVCLLYPEGVRATNLRLRGTWIRPMPRLMSSGQELWSIRISGAGAILMGLLLALALYERLAAP